MEKKNPRPPTLTVGELCHAIAEGQLPATLHDNQWYQVSAREVRRFAKHQQPMSAYAARRSTRKLQS